MTNEYLQIHATTFSTKFKSLKASAILNKKKIILSPHMVCPERGCEHPAINRKFQGRRYKFSYVIGWLESVNSGPFANGKDFLRLEVGCSNSKIDPRLRALK